MKPRTKLILQLSIGAVILTAVGFVTAYFIKQYKRAYDYCYKFTNGKIVSAGIQKTIVSVTLKIFNATDINAQISQQNYKIYVNDIHISNITSSERIALNAMNSYPIPLTIEFNPLQILKETLLKLDSILLDKQYQDKIRIVVTGNVTISAGGLSVKNLPINYSSTLTELLAPAEDGYCKNIKF